MTNNLPHDASEDDDIPVFHRQAIDAMSIAPTLSDYPKPQLNDEISFSDRETFSTVQFERRPHESKGLTNDFPTDVVMTNEKVAELVRDTLLEIFDYLKFASSRLQIATSRTNRRFRQEDLESSKWSIEDVRDHFVYRYDNRTQRLFLLLKINVPSFKFSKFKQTLWSFIRGDVPILGRRLCHFWTFRPDNCLKILHRVGFHASQVCSDTQDLSIQEKQCRDSIAEHLNQRLNGYPSDIRAAVA